MKDSPRDFHLLRYFAGASFAVLLVTLASLTLLVARREEAVLIARSQGYAIRYARQLNVQIHADFLFPLRARGAALDLPADPGQLAALEGVVRSHMRHMEVVKVVLYDPKGTIFYSTDASILGRNNWDNEKFRRALAGEPNSKIVHKGSDPDIKEGQRKIEQDLLETYVPLDALAVDGTPTGETGGVVEIYQDVTRLYAEVARAQREALLAGVAAFCLLFGTLFFVVLKAHRLIRARTGALRVAGEELRRWNETLEEKARERAAELERTRDALEESRRRAALGELAARIADEVNNPLGVVVTKLTHLLTIAEEEGWPPGLVAELGKVLAHGERAARTVAALASFDPQTLGPRRVADLNVLVQSAVEAARRRASERAVEIVPDLAPRLLSVLVDPPEVELAVELLLASAIDATGPLGVVHVKTEALPGNGPGVRARVRVTVTDTGASIPPEELERLFDARSAPATGRGAGNGLAAVRGIVAAHGGEMRAASGPSETTLVVELPSA